VIDAYVLKAVGIVYHSNYEYVEQFLGIAFNYDTYKTKTIFTWVLLIECTL